MMVTHTYIHIEQVGEKYICLVHWNDTAVQKKDQKYQVQPSGFLFIYSLSRVEKPNGK